MKRERSGSTRSTGLRRESSGKRESLKTGRSLSWQGRASEPNPVIGAMGAGRRLLAFAGGSLAAGAAAYAFYRSFLAFAVFMIPACVYPWAYEKTWRREQKQRLELQFKEAILVMAGALSAGYSAENAVAVSGRELEQLYGPQGMIVREFRRMNEQMNLNRSVEQVIQEFADRSGLEEARRFARIFRIAKRSGGGLTPVICHTVSVMEDRSQVKEEIRTMTSSVQFEQKIMNGIPFLMIFYIDMTSPGFFGVMYETVLGRLIMTGCLAVYLLSMVLSRKILDIRMA